MGVFSTTFRVRSEATATVSMICLGAFLTFATLTPAGTSMLGMYSEILWCEKDIPQRFGKY